MLLEYARTAMFMWMFIEGLYLHNMVTVAVFQGRFPHKIFSLLGWGLPVLMTTVWAICTAVYTDSAHDCLWNYNLTPYYWILEGPRFIVISVRVSHLLLLIVYLSNYNSLHRTAQLLFPNEHHTRAGDETAPESSQRY